MALRSRELSVVEHVTDALDRLAADPYNTVITLDDRALERAAALDAELAAGRWRGPLHGVAVGVKDLIDVAGLPTKCGSLVFADAPPAAVDAPVVARLLEAGAVVVAKLHTHEFAYGPTGDVSATGPARNPHDPTRITGGSSSGSAPAVAPGRPPPPPPAPCHSPWAPTRGRACARRPRCAGWSGSSRRSGRCPPSGSSHCRRPATTSASSPPTCTAPRSPGTCSSVRTAPAAASRPPACRVCGSASCSTT